MKAFEVIEHTADIGIRAFGKDVHELFCNSARGMFGLIIEDGSKRGTTRLDIDLRSEELESLLIRWLNELLFHFSKKGFIPFEFFIAVNDNRIKGTVTGENMDISNKTVKMEVKAATYHQARIIPPLKPGLPWQAEFILDV